MDDIVRVFSDQLLDLVALIETWHKDSDSVPIKHCGGGSLPCWITILRKLDSGQITEILHWLQDQVFILRKSTATKQSARLNICAAGPQPTQLHSQPMSAASFTVLALYWPGSAHITTEFFSEFLALLEVLILCLGQLVITGDINVRLERSADNTIQLNSLLTDFDLLQLVDKHTHDSGGLLDVMITRHVQITRLKRLRSSMLEYLMIALFEHPLTSVFLQQKTPSSPLVCGDVLTLTLSKKICSFHSN